MPPTIKQASFYFKKMTIYFLESLNGVGKSALIDHLPDSIHKERIENRPELEESGEARIAAIWDSSSRLYMKYRNANFPAIVNRSYLSEIVYSEALNRAYSKVDMELMMNMWKIQNGTIIYLERNFPIEVVLKRRPNFTKKFLLNIEKLYEKFLLESTLDIAQISVGENPLDSLELLEKIIKC